MKNLSEKKFRGNNRETAKRSYLDFPIGTFGNVPIFEILSNREVSIENYDLIMEYDDNFIKILSHKLMVSFWGKNLVLKYMTKDSLVITGIISSIEFEK